MKNLKNHFPDNILDDDFQKMLLPLNIMQTVVLQQKYSIKNGSIVPNGAFHHILGLLSVVFIVFVHYRRNANPDEFYLIFKMESFMSTIVIFDAAMYTASSIILFCVNIYHNHNNVRLILKIQRTYRVVGASKHVHDFKILNWFYISMLIGMYLLLIVSYYALFVFEAGFYFFLFSLMFFDVNVIFITRLLTFLVYEVKMWRVNIDKLVMSYSKSYHTQLRRPLLEIDFEEKKLYAAYVDLLEAYKLCGDIFQIPIFILIVDLVIHPLLYIQTVIEIKKATTIFNDFSITSVLTLYSSFFWMAKNYTLMGCFCFANQQFSLAVTEVDVACAVILSKGTSANVRRLCKKVRRLNATRPARGVGAADAALPLRLLALLATYTVVLLQFAFL